ncbi:DUF481 domain-containing protein [Steroidobacter flavus]|uniref:DUF481 domain-containing protein n=1 Tax=Steroidobacter flavus TaxID=1842136 RepID=A0ABV8SSX5_9GAMM
MISERRHVACQSLVLSLALSLLGVAHAADKKPTNDKLPDWAPKPKPHVIEDRFRLEVMTLSAELDTDIRIDPSVITQGTLINAEDDLGLDDNKLLPLVELTLLPGDRHLIRLSGFSVRRSAEKAIDQTIVFDDQTYRPGERVDSTLNLTSFGLTYGYSVVKTRRMDLALSFGVQIVEVEANAVVRSRVVRDSETGVTPLPLAGIEGRFDFTDRWSFEARAQYLSVEFDEIDGSVLDARAALTWRMNPYLVFGLGYRDFHVEVDSRDVDDPGIFDMKMAGPLLFMRASL